MITDTDFKLSKFQRAKSNCAMDPMALIKLTRVSCLTLQAHLIPSRQGQMLASLAERYLKQSARQAIREYWCFKLSVSGINTCL